MPKLVIDMKDRRPVWAMPDWSVEAIAAALPAGWAVQVMETPADGSGDGATTLSQETLRAVEDATVYLGYGVREDLLRVGPGLRWVHSGAAGVGGSLSPEMLERDLVFTNSAGVHGPPMAETVLAMILYFSRGLDYAVTGGREHRWWQEPFYEADTPVGELSDWTVGILGYGGVGREVARRLAPLGPRILGLRRRPPPGTESGSQAVAEVLHGPAGLKRLLEESDVTVVTAPHTAETHRILNRRALSRMKRGAVLVNVSRGALVDEKALVEMLRDGRLRGAALDVFQAEPLPRDHPFWSLPNVLVLPHVSGVSRRFWQRETELIVENIRRFLAGQPLLNTVDKRAGY